MRNAEIESLVAEANAAYEVAAKPAIEADRTIQTALRGIEELERSSLKAFRAAGGVDAVIRETAKISDLAKQMGRMQVVAPLPPDPKFVTASETQRNTQDTVILLEAQIEQIQQGRTEDRLLTEKQRTNDRRLAIWIGLGGAVLAAIAASVLTVVLTLIFLQ